MMFALIRVVCILCWLPVILSAQQATSVTASDADFPTIQIDFTFRNPDTLPADAVLLQDGRSIPYTLTVRPDSTCYQQKRILLLFENSYRPRFDAQRTAGISLLKRVFREAIATGDEVYVAHFDWTIEGAPDFILLNDAPVDDPAIIDSLLDNIVQPRSDGRLVEETEIYPALMDGLDFMAARDTSRSSAAPIILLYSAEATNIHFSRFSQSDVVMKSQELDIPVYTLQYPYYRDKYSFAELTEKTYGERTILVEEENAAATLIQQLKHAPIRSSGKRYTIQFEAEQPGSGSMHMVSLQLSNLEQIDLTYHTDSALVYWFRPALNKIIALGGLLLLLAGIAFAWVYTRKRRQQQYSLEKAAQQEQLKQVSADAAAALKRQEDAFQQQLEERERAQKAKAQQAAAEERRRQIQSRFDRLPRVPCLVSEAGEQFVIQLPRTIIGRGPQVDLVLSDMSISKRHALVAFATFQEDGSGELSDEFYLLDLNSTNGTYVNGYPATKASDIISGKKPKPLKDQDLVQFGGQQYVFTI